MAAISVAEPFLFRRNASRISSKAELSGLAGEGCNRCASLEALIELTVARGEARLFQDKVAEPSIIASRGAFWLAQSNANPFCSLRALQDGVACEFTAVVADDNSGLATYPR